MEMERGNKMEMERGGEGGMERGDGTGMRGGTGTMRIRTAVVTGATSGIGLASLKALVAEGWACLAVGRSRSRIESAEREVLSQTPEARVHWQEADLSSVSGTLGLATRIRACLANGVPGGTATQPETIEDCGSRTPALFPADPSPLDALVLCAGCVTDWYLATEDGYETQFAVNHLSQFLLARALRLNLQAAPEARIITISSGSHYGTRIRWDDIMLRRHYSPLAAYKQSKLCNVLFAAEWNRRYADAAVAVAVDPGLVRTEIGLKGTSGLVRAVWKWRMKSGIPADIPARHVTELLTGERGRLRNAVYWSAGRPQRESANARDGATAQRLWRLSEKLCPMFR